MDKKKKISDDLKGFEDFVENSTDEVQDKNPRTIGGDNLTFVLNDNSRLRKVATFMADTLPVSKSHQQGKKIINQQQYLVGQLKQELIHLLNPSESPLHQSLSDIWNGYFEEKKR